MLQKKIQCSNRNLLIQLSSCNHISRKIYPRKKSIVIEHLFKMRDEPSCIHCIPVKPAAHMIKKSALIHTDETFFQHIQSLLLTCCFVEPQQIIKVMGQRELWSLKKSTLMLIINRNQRGKGLLLDFIIQISFFPLFLHWKHCFHSKVRGRKHSFFFLQPQGWNPRKDFQKTHMLTFGFFRQIGGCKEWLSLRCQNKCHGPAPIPRHGLAETHMDVIHIRPFFLIYLHRDKIAVQHLSQFQIFKGLPFHHMAPVTGSISDGKKNRFVFFPCFLKSFFSPGIPVHGIHRMMSEIGRFLQSQSIHFLIYMSHLITLLLLIQVQSGTVSLHHTQKILLFCEVRVLFRDRKTFC